jgi:hypothetical protein
LFSAIKVQYFVFFHLFIKHIHQQAEIERKLNNLVTFSLLSVPVHSMEVMFCHTRTILMKKKRCSKSISPFIYNHACLMLLKKMDDRTFAVNITEGDIRWLIPIFWKFK